MVLTGKRRKRRKKKKKKKKKIREGWGKMTWPIGTNVFLVLISWFLIFFFFFPDGTKKTILPFPSLKGKKANFPPSKNWVSKPHSTFIIFILPYTYIDLFFHFDLFNTCFLSQFPLSIYIYIYFFFFFFLKTQSLLYFLSKLLFIFSKSILYQNFFSPLFFGTTLLFLLVFILKKRFLLPIVININKQRQLAF